MFPRLPSLYSPAVLHRRIGGKSRNVVFMPSHEEQTGSDTTTTPRRSSWPRWLLAALLLTAIGGFYALGLSRYFSWDYIRDHLAALKAEAQQHLPIALLLFFLVYLTITALSLPAAGMLTMLAGALFDLVLGTAVASLASTLGATLAFLSSRYLLRDWVQRRFGARLRTLNEGVEKDGAYYLFTLRLVAVIPFFLINLGMGLTPMRARTFALASWLGMLPGTFLYVYAGRALGRVQSPSDLVSPGVLIALALLGVVPLALRKILQCRGKSVSG
jgi:uncharacterized membrane protein YdjX (TVP38/TMEM64 family)